MLRGPLPRRKARVFFATEQRRMRSSDVRAGHGIGVTDKGMVPAARLAEAEAMLRALGEACPDLLYAKDRDGRLRYMNPAGLAVIGRPAAEVIGRTDAEYMPDRAQAETLMRNDARIMRRGCTETVVELVTDARFGETRMWESTKTPLRDPTSGQVTGLVGIARDVTDARRAERALADSELRFRETFEQAAMGFAHLSLDGRWLRVNRRLCEMLGYNEQELLGRWYEELTHPEDRAANAKGAGKILRGEESILRMDKRYIRKDGTPLWVNLTASVARDEAGTPRYVISVLQDTSRRRAAEAKLAASEARLQDLVKTLDLAAVMAHDLDGTIRFWSAGCERLYGWTAEDALGRVSHHLLRTSSSIPLSEIEAAVLRDGEWSGDLRHLRRDGSMLIAAVRKVLRRDADGCPVAIMESVTDATRLYQTEEELRRLNDELADRVRAEVAARERAQADLAQAQRLEALGKLAGGIAHDFNNVLQAVSGAATMMERRAAEPDRVRRLARLAQEAAGRGAAITGRLLAFARRGDLRITTVPATDVLFGLREMLHQTLGPGIAIQVEVSEEAPLLLADRAQLETVLVNLAVNARDAMPDGGELVLSARVESIDGPHPTGLGPADYVRLDVTDTGTGMNEFTRSHAAEPFFTTKPTGQGTGLGLAMARGFAQQSGGALGIRSALAQGTTISVWLPRATTSPVPHPPSDNAGQPIGGSGRILVVDDDAMVREVVAAELCSLGYAAIAAEDGAAALRMIDAGEAPHLMVTDFSMPGMNGIALIREARLRMPGLPVLLMTGYADAVMGGDAQELFDHATMLAHKPVSSAQLAALVAEMIGALQT